jgi:hypothetical protein
MPGQSIIACVAKPTLKENSQVRNAAVVVIRSLVEPVRVLQDTVFANKGYEMLHVFQRRVVGHHLTDLVCRYCGHRRPQHHILYGFQWDYATEVCVEVE